MTDPLPQPPTLPGITWRPARKEDAAAIVALQDVCFETDGGWREVESEILDRWTSDYCIVEDDSLVGVTDDGDVVVSVWSNVPSIAETKWRGFHDNYVHPDRRTPEIRDFVMHWWEARCRQRFDDNHDDLPQFLWQDAYDWQTDRIEFIEEHGYTPMRYYDELLADLSRAIPDRSLPEDLAVQSWETASLDDSRAVHNSAFLDHWGSQPISEKRWAQNAGDFLLREASFVVYDDGEPVAYLMAAAFPHDFADKGRREAWIEGLGTVRSHRKQGIGTALVTRAMGEFVALDMEFAVLGVDSENSTGAYALYEALGFVHDRRSIAYVKQVQ